MKKSLPNCTEIEISVAENVDAEALLTPSTNKGYIHFSSFSAGVAKLAYAADSKSAGVHSPWGFKSLLRHKLTDLRHRRRLQHAT